MYFLYQYKYLVLIWNCTDPSSGVDQSQHLVGPIRGTMGWEGRRPGLGHWPDPGRWSASGVDWPRELTGLGRWLGSDQEVLTVGWCHPPIPTGRSDHGGGGQVGGGTVGAWRPRASVPQKSNNRRGRWLQSHTPSTNRERPDLRSTYAWGMGTRQYAPPLKNHWDRYDPGEDHVPGGNLHTWYVRRAEILLRRVTRSWGAWVGTQVVTPRARCTSRRGTYTLGFP